MKQAYINLALFFKKRQGIRFAAEYLFDKGIDVEEARQVLLDE